MADKPLAPIAIAFGLGIVAAAYSSSLACMLLGGSVVLALLVMKSGPTRSLLAILLAALALGAIRYGVSREVPANDVSKLVPRVVAFQGTVAGDPESRSGSVRVFIEATRAQTDRGWLVATGKVATNIYDPAASDLALEYGDLVTIHVRPYTPMDPTNPGQFSWRGYLARQGVYSCASVREPSEVSKAPVGGGNALVKAALAVKRYVIGTIFRLHPKREASLISGMVLGTYAYLPQDVLNDFQRTGTLHLLAASGYNCFILVFFAAPLLTVMRVFPRYKGVVLILLLIVYLLMVGPKPSLVRATIMMSLFLLGKLLRRVPSTQNLFYAAAIVVLMMNPSDLFDVGFQLSFLGVGALITIVPVVEAILRRAGWVGFVPTKNRSLAQRAIGKSSAAVVETAAATGAVSLVTGPIVAYYFNYLSLVSLPANVVMGLGVSVVFADGLLAAIFGPIPVIGSAIGFAGTWAARAMLAAVGALGSPSWSAAPVASPSAAMLAGYYIVLFGVYDYLRSRYAA